MRRPRGLERVALALVTIAAGCSQTPSATRQDIALIDVPEPPRLVVTIAGHPDAGGTQARRMFYQNDVRVAALKLTAALKPASLRAGAAATDALGAALRGRVVHVRDPRPGREELLDDYAAVSTQAARDLDVVPAAIGYWTAYPEGAYRPWVVLTYRLRDNATGTVLASGSIGSGPAPGDGPLAAVMPDDAFTFASFDALAAEPQRAAEGLRTTLRKVAEALAAKL